MKPKGGATNPDGPPQWLQQQSPNLIALSIAQANLPSIKMITEAGIIGKIGLNSHGVGCTLNAIRAPGMDPTRMPCHLALRAVLESPTKDAAVATLDKHGVASSCTITIADPASGAVSLEWSAIDVQKLWPDDAGRLYHSNHYLVDHPGVKDTQYLRDSIARVARIRELTEGLAKQGEPGVSELRRVFEDERGAPHAINRKEDEAKDSQTLFNIICDLKAKKAFVTVGRPTEAESSFELGF